MKFTTKLSGRARVQIADIFGNTIQDFGWEPNLLLDQGMDAVAEVLYADLWKYCAAGIDNTDTKRTLAGNVSQSGGTTTVINTVAEFALTDVGRMLKVSGNVRRLVSFTSTTEMEVDIVGNFVAAGGGKIYNVEQTGLFDERARTNIYSSASNANKTTTVGNVRTMKRTFLFPAEPAAIAYKEIGWSHEEARPIQNIASLSIPAADTVRVTTDEPHGLPDTTSITVAGVTGSTPSVDGAYGLTLISPTEFDLVVVGVTNAGSGGTFQPNGPLSNLNIRIKTAATINVAQNQRLKVIYEFDVTVEPNTEQSGASNITGGSGPAFSNPNAKWAIEKFATSIVNIDGSTDDTGVELEPSVPGVMAMSDTSTAISALSPVSRNLNVEIVDLNPTADYVSGEYELEYSGVFDLEDGNSEAIRSLMIYDEDSSHGVFTMRFDNAQTKDADHSLTIIWKKAWDRELN